MENRRSGNKYTSEDWSKGEWGLLESHSLNQLETIKIIDSSFCKIIHYLSGRNMTLS